MIAAKCKKCGNIGCNGDNSLCNNSENFIYIPVEIQEYLDKNFILCDLYTYKSQNKWIGAGTGDDSTLYLYLDDSSTVLWWKENRGFEKTIFEGRKIKSVQELETIFDLLEIKNYIKWN